MLPENGACRIAWNTHQPSGGFCWQEYSGSLPAVPLCPECYDSTIYCQQRLAALALYSGGCVVANPEGHMGNASGGRVGKRSRVGIEDSQVPHPEKIISSMSIPGSDTQLYLVEIPAPL